MRAIIESLCSANEHTELYMAFHEAIEGVIARFARDTLK